MENESLKDILRGLNTLQKRFILLRITGLDPDTARKMSNIKLSRYNSWTNQPRFHLVYIRMEELIANKRDEAVNLLRRENQLSAIMLEEKIIKKLQEEVESGEYVLAKTNLGREVYTKLVNDLDFQPRTVGLTWEQRIIELSKSDPKLEEPKGDIVDGEFVEAEGSPQEQHSESNAVKSPV
jgi:hypothetical protein